MGMWSEDIKEKQEYTITDTVKLENLETGQEGRK